MSSSIKFKLGPPATSPATSGATTNPDQWREDLRRRFHRVRQTSMALAAPLHPEDQVVQSMPDASPTKWHLAHVTWFFETFLLKAFQTGYDEYDTSFAFLFNSYYHTVGEMHARPRRGLLSRPTVEEVLGYRAHVDEAMDRLLAQAPSDTFADIAFLVEIGLNHEQQHQELLLTDIKHVLSCNPLLPAAYAPPPPTTGARPPRTWLSFEGGHQRMGHDGSGFAFDNECPRHDILQPPFRIASRPVTNGEYRDFIADGGYDTVALWLSDGWATIREHGWTHPLYWQERDGAWFEFTLAGLVPLDPDKPVCHLSHYEADAFASWAGKRLPTEAELERITDGVPVSGNLLDAAPPLDDAEPLTAPEPRAASADADAIAQVFGDVWEWSQSAYGPYPGFRPLDGSLGEYNGKFMCNQVVLRGGSSATPADHIRPTYRNFFPSDARWQVSGIRLAEDVRG